MDIKKASFTSIKFINWARYFMQIESFTSAHHFIFGTILLHDLTDEYQFKKWRDLGRVLLGSTVKYISKDIYVHFRDEIKMTYDVFTSEKL